MEIKEHKYVECYRCGIIMGLLRESNQVFCADCNHPSLIGVFRPQSFAWIFEGEE